MGFVKFKVYIYYEMANLFEDVGQKNMFSDEKLENVSWPTNLFIHKYYMKENTWTDCIIYVFWYRLWDFSVFKEYKV